MIKQVGMLAGDPSFALCTQGASGNEAVEMNMGLELLIPGMQDGHKAQFAAKLLFTKSCQGLRDGLKQDGEHHGFVCEDDWIQLMGEGKYDMEVGKGQQFGFLLLKPPLSGDLLTFGAVSITAGMIDDTLSTAVVAALKVTATISGATAQQVGYDSVLIRPQRIGALIVSDMVSENICYL